MDAQSHILVVDDEEDICDILRFNLEADGFKVSVASSAEAALALPSLASVSLFLLDIMMDGMSGLAMAKRLKSMPACAYTPVIFITARDSENDTVTGFTLGADDYITKPFKVKEVVLRVRAVLRRSSGDSAEPSSLLSFQGLSVSVPNKAVSVDGVAVPLTKKEFEILCLFLQNLNRVFSRDEILQRIWPDDVFVLARTVDVNITRLRKKIEPYGRGIVTRQGFGYCFDPSIF